MSAIYYQYSLLISLSSAKNTTRSTSGGSLGASSQADDPVSCLPSEVVLHIFSLVPEYDLVRNCQLVCKEWRSFVVDPYFWQSKIPLTSKPEISSQLFELGAELKLNWAKLYMRVINKNLLNSFDEKGQLSLSPWQIIQDGGDGWQVEQGIQDDNVKGDRAQLIKENCGSKNNYATSYNKCSRHQIVDLVAAGLHPEILDKLQPKIEASEWYSARWDCGSTYWVRVTLRDNKKKKIVEDAFEDTTPQWVGGDKGWCRYSHSFSNYGPGVRYVEFWDQGKDTQFWAGHYGSKMAGAIIKVSFN